MDNNNFEVIVSSFMKEKDISNHKKLDNNSINYEEKENSAGPVKKYGVKAKKKLRGFPHVLKALDDVSPELLIDLHFLLFLTAADSNKLKDNILQFDGFSFGSDCEEYDERNELLQRMPGKLIDDVARSFSLDVASKKKETIQNILSFLMKPDESHLRTTGPVKKKGVYVKKKLREFPLVLKALDDASQELLIDLHFLLFLNSADSNKLKDNILQFDGFSFGSDCEEYDERNELLQRMPGNLITDVARSFSLGVTSKKGKTIRNILSFLMKPDESHLRTSDSDPVILSDVELDDTESSSDSDESITWKVVEEKVQFVDLRRLSGEDSGVGHLPPEAKTLMPNQPSSVQVTNSKSTSVAELPSEEPEYFSAVTSGEEYVLTDLNEAVSDDPPSKDSLPSIPSPSIPHQVIWKKPDFYIKSEKHLETTDPSEKIQKGEEKNMTQQQKYSGEEYVLSDLDEIASDDSFPSLPNSSVAHEVIWEKHDSCIKSEKFVETTGPSEEIQYMSDKSPLALFLRMFTMELTENIVCQSNLYATQKKKPFTSLEVAEFFKFLAINLLMGIKRLPSYSDYWSSAPDLHDAYISSQMSLKRFSWILSNFHLNDNLVLPKKGEPGFNKLCKLRPFLSYLSEKFRSVLHPHEKQVIQESIIILKGCSILRPQKPIKHGYKIWMRCDESGFACEFDIYSGKTGKLTEKNLAKRVVTNLCSSLFGKNHKMFMDNFFTSYNLFRFLQAQQIYCCGTVNLTSKNLPKNMEKDKNLRRGDFDWFVSNDGITCIKWKDRECITMLSNQNDSTDVLEVHRKAGDGSILNINCPKAVVEYNRNMGFADNFTHLKSLYEINRKSKKWWHRIFFYFLDTIVVNAFILHKMLHSDTKMTLKDFRREIISGLIHLGGSSTVHKRPIQSSETPVQRKKHKPFVSDEKRLLKEHFAVPCTKRRRCALCSTRKKDKRTKWMCLTCKVPLCMQARDNNCFKKFHTE